MKTENTTCADKPQKKQRCDRITVKTEAKVTTFHRLVRTVIHYRGDDFNKNLKQKNVFCFQQTAPPSTDHPFMLGFATAK